MKSVFKSVIAIVVGVFLFMVLVLLIEQASHHVFPLPPGIDPTDPKQLAAIMDTIPLGAKVFVVVAWIVGAVVGSLAASRLAEHSRMRHGLVIGAVGLLGALANLLKIPHPTWMSVVGLGGIAAGSWLGARIGAGAVDKGDSTPDGSIVL